MYRVGCCDSSSLIAFRPFAPNLISITYSRVSSIFCVANTHNFDTPRIVMHLRSLILSSMPTKRCLPSQRARNPSHACFVILTREYVDSTKGCRGRFAFTFDDQLWSDQMASRKRRARCANQSFQSGSCLCRANEMHRKTTANLRSACPPGLHISSRVEFAKLREHTWRGRDSTFVIRSGILQLNLAKLSGISTFDL